MIALRNVGFSKGSGKLFEDLSFTIRPGEHWVIQGDNGSGKTLLLQLLAGAIHPQQGEVNHSFISGKDWDTLYRQRQENIHFIPTHWLQSFLGGFTGLFYQQRYYAMDDTALPKVSDVLGDSYHEGLTTISSGSFDVSALLPLPLTRLSNGQLRKVILLRQLAQNIPKFLILDYPFDGLDAESRKDLNQFIEQISGKFGIQIILVDHGEDVPSVMNRRLVLENFRIKHTEIIRRGDAKSLPPPAVISANPPADRPAVVEMRDVTIQYNGKKIISNLNWRIGKGERWALTGKNGSGKTTLFSLIYADHPMAYSQAVFLFGKRRGSGESIWDIKKRINYFGPEQTHFLNPGTIHFTAREYISMQPHKDPAGIRDLVSFFDAGKYIDLPMKYLSSGQVQMVLLMNMFLEEKELLLLDEPFQYLDPHNHQRITDYLSHYLSKDVTLVMITHDERDVAKWTQHRKILP